MACRRNLAVSASRDATVRLWDAQRLRQLKLLHLADDLGIGVGVSFGFATDFEQHLALFADGRCHVMAWSGVDAEESSGVEGAASGDAAATADAAAAAPSRKRKQKVKAEVKRWRLRHEAPDESPSSPTSRFLDLAEMVALDAEGALAVYDFHNGVLKVVNVGIVSCNLCF